MALSNIRTFQALKPILAFGAVCLLLAGSVSLPSYATAQEPSLTNAAAEAFSSFNTNRNNDSAAIPSDMPTLVEVQNGYIAYSVPANWDCEVSDDGLMAFFSSSGIMFQVMTSPAPVITDDYASSAQQLSSALLEALGVVPAQQTKVTLYTLDNSVIAMNAATGTQTTSQTEVQVFFTTVFNSDSYSTAFSLFDAGNTEARTMASILHDSILPLAGIGDPGIMASNEALDHFTTVHEGPVSYQVGDTWQITQDQTTSSARLVTYSLPSDLGYLQVYSSGYISQDPDTDAKDTFDDIIASSPQIRDLKDVSWHKHRIGTNTVYYAACSMDLDGTPYEAWLTMVFGQEGYTQFSAVYPIEAINNSASASLTYACKSLKFGTEVPAAQIRETIANLQAGSEEPLKPGGIMGILLGK